MLVYLNVEFCLKVYISLPTLLTFFYYLNNYEPNTRALFHAWGKLFSRLNSVKMKTTTSYAKNFHGLYLAHRKATYQLILHYTLEGLAPQTNGCPGVSPKE